MDEEINYALFFGRRSLAYESEGALYTMNGVDQQILTHVRSGAGLAYPTWELFNEWISPTFDDNSSSDSKVLFVGKNLFHVILSAARGMNVQFASFQTVLGSTVVRILVDGGSVDIVKDYKALQGPLSGDGFVIDSAHVEFRPFNNYGRVVIPNVQANSEIFKAKDTIVQAGSLALFHEGAHMRLKDFEGPFGK